LTCRRAVRLEWQYSACTWVTVGSLLESWSTQSLVHGKQASRQAGKHEPLACFKISPRLVSSSSRGTSRGLFPPKAAHCCLCRAAPLTCPSAACLLDCLTMSVLYYRYHYFYSYYYSLALPMAMQGHSTSPVHAAMTKLNVPPPESEPASLI